ncbi:MAG: glycosyltransferase family 1 protein [Candidatus Hecatellales archaeon]|nr:MAG: glycosyltransferase family 1 protein [Candidatus Hecatellales archaeon]
MNQIKLCVNTQTPLVRFKLNYEEILEKYGYLYEPINLKDLVENEDYQFTPGGVAEMTYAILKRFMVRGLVSSPKWVSLNPNAPLEVFHEGVHIYNVQLPSFYVPRYTGFKEGIWREIHGLGKMEIRKEEYEAYAYYNWLCTQTMLKFLPDIDIFWIHDFQQLQVGSMIGPSAPTIFRWHIPFKLEHVSPRLRNFIMKNMESYDAVIVSTKRDLEGLIRAGYHGKAYQIYPYVDPEKWGKVNGKKLDETLSKYGIMEDEKVILVVARMDRVKGQDTAIKALPIVKKENPNTKLLLVGDGSFTSTSLGHSKGENWRRELKKLAEELKVEDSVKFLGYVDEEELKCLYMRADVVLLPSLMEGFGLTVVEAWNYRKPVVVSRGAGSSELIIENVNGLTHNPQDYRELAGKISYLLGNEEDALRMGEVGYETSKQCSISVAVERLKTVFESVIKSY